MTPIFINPKNVRDVISLSRSYCDELERQGRFPKKIMLSTGRKAWLYSDLIAWANERIKENRPEHGGVVDMRGLLQSTPTQQGEG